jgi:hypothetical protein
MNNKKVTKKTLRSQHNTIELDQNFYDFYIELKKYFKSNSMPKCVIKLVENPHRFQTSKKPSRNSKYSIKIFEEDTCNIEFLSHKNGVELLKFQMIQKGTRYTTSFMNAFTQISKSLNIKIHLIPSEPQQRNNFYYKFNFRKIRNSKFWIN